jgi:hypothetical protein
MRYFMRMRLIFIYFFNCINYLYRRLPYARTCIPEEDTNNEAMYYKCVSISR